MGRYKSPFPSSKRLIARLRCLCHIFQYNEVYPYQSSASRFIMMFVHLFIPSTTCLEAIFHDLEAICDGKSWRQHPTGSIRRYGARRRSPILH